MWIIRAELPLALKGVKSNIKTRLLLLLIAAQLGD
jgi:hypothetical protein